MSNNADANDMRMTRRLSFVQEMKRLTAATGMSQRAVFDVYNAEFPTFETYQSFRKFKGRYCHRVSQPNPLNDEIQGIFSELLVIDRGGDEIEYDPTLLDKEELKRFVADLKRWVVSDKDALHEVLSDYARLIAGSGRLAEASHDLHRRAGRLRKRRRRG